MEEEFKTQSNNTKEKTSRPRAFNGRICTRGREFEARRREKGGFEAGFGSIEWGIHQMTLLHTPSKRQCQ